MFDGEPPELKYVTLGERAAVKKEAVKNALKTTSDFGKLNYLDASKLPAWLGFETVKSLQTLEKYTSKPLVLLTQHEQCTLTVYVNGVKVKEIQSEDLSKDLKEISYEF